MISTAKAHNGYLVQGLSLKNPIIMTTIDFLTKMDICENCVDFSEYNLKIGAFKYHINYGEKKITVS